MAREYRETDWVTNDAVWTPADVPWEHGSDTILFSPLTSWAAPALQLPGIPEEGGALTVERVKGQILWMLESPLSEAVRTGEFMFRIRVGEQEPTSALATPVVPPGYDPADSALVANESFLWTHSWQFWSAASWWTGASGQSSPSGSVDVDVKSRRRLEQYQQLQIVSNWRSRDANILPRILLWYRLRTLLSWR